MQQHTTAKGLIIRETDFGDSERYITVLTEAGAKIEVLCRGVRRKGSRIANAVRLFCYTEYTLFESRGKYTLNDAALITGFWGIAQDIESYALACYFAELLLLVTETDEPCPAFINLMLYALHTLEDKKRPKALVKAAFELRLFADAGFAPNISACGACGKSLEEGAFFSIREGAAVCGDCVNRIGGDFMGLMPGAYAAMRHILSCGIERVFSFSLGEISCKQFADICEKYTLFYADKGFESLDFYHSLFRPFSLEEPKLGELT